jgi:serine protease inhibitor
MSILRSLLAIWIPAGMVGCGLLEPGPDRGPLTELPRPLSAAEQAVVGASNEFAFGLLREARRLETEPNLFLSPLSASMALGMTLNGARGGTRDEMRATLGFGDMEQASINASYRSLIDLLLTLDDGVEMRIANALWVRHPFPLHEAFVRTSRDYFGAEAASLDFGDPASLRTINDWVSRSTAGRITRILEELDGDVVLYLMNAIYFKGDWTTRFDARRTHEAPFHRADGTTQTVRMMELRGQPVQWHHGGDVQIVDLPYARGAFRMTLVMPGWEGGSLSDLVNDLDRARWEGWLARLAEGRPDLYLPRFELEYETTLDQTLQALGMRQAFVPRVADFGGISPAPVDLHIDEVKQKTFLKVNEQGTEAAAVTSIGVAPVSANPMFRADRPFLLAIRERLSGTILFIGTIGAPDSR